jgi:hypothetical protein
MGIDAWGWDVGFKRFIAAGANGNYIEGGEPLDGWSTADIARRKSLEAKIFTRFVDHQKEFPGLQAPVGADLEDLAAKEFFDYRWREVCEQTGAVKL